MEVEDFSDLKGLTTEKLLKLRDVSYDNFLESQKTMRESWDRYDQILKEIEERHNVQKAT